MLAGNESALAALSPSARTSALKFLAPYHRHHMRPVLLVEYEREARELLRHKEISDKICQMIAKISRKEILTEEKFVNEFTAALYQSELVIKFVIPENAVLYALMATEVYNIGLENFCNAKKADK